MTQAVILAGGRGTRLAPLTDSIPKPMVDVNGEPFLAHLITLLAGQGVTVVLLLTGYRGEQIEDHFGSGGEFGLTIRYSHGPEEWSTGERLLAANDDLDSMFLLLYADNYVAFEMAKLLEHAPDSHASMVLTVCPKASGNIVLNPDGSVLKYLRDRSIGGGEFVEVGFSLTNRDRLLHAVELNGGSLPAAIESLTAAGEVRANVVSHPYFSVSDPQRLERTRQALSRRRVLLLDRDGVINVKAPTGEYVSRFEDFEPIMGNWRALAKLAEQGFSFIIISNQAGVARGMIDPADLDYLHGRMLKDMQDLGLNVLGIYVCPHHWDDNCCCRKPLPGMFNLAADEHSFLLADVIYVGDDVRDEAAALAAGCTSVLIGPEAELAGAASTGQFDDLTQAIPFITDHYENRDRSTPSSTRIDGGR